MEEEITIQESLIDQILDEMFERIQGANEFDTTTIQKLRQLAKSGDLAKATRVTGAIKAELEET